MKKLILDVDTGIDDALAIAMVLGMEDVSLAGVTVVFGNTYLSYAVRNTLDVLCELGHPEIGVYPGAEYPWGQNDWLVSDHLKVIHGNNGVGNVSFKYNQRKPKNQSACDFMIEAAKKYKEELIIVNLGPLTNLANAINKNREAMSLCGTIAIMGGALTVKGNITPYAEANIFNDPAAAKYVMESGLDLTMIGLDVTLKTVIMEDDISFLKEITTVAFKHIYDMAYYYYVNEEGVLGGAMHDPLAVAAAIDPSLITKWHDISLEVWQNGPGVGRIVTTGDMLVKPNKNVRYALDVNSESFKKRFKEALRKAVNRPE